MLFTDFLFRRRGEPEGSILEGKSSDFDLVLLHLPVDGMKSQSCMFILCRLILRSDMFTFSWANVRGFFSRNFLRFLNS